MSGRWKAPAAIVVSIAAISAGTWGLSRWAPFEHESTTIAWPENVQPIVDYIEGATNLRFLSSIGFEYIDDVDEYNDRARDPIQELTQADRDSVAVDEAVGRALGLWVGDTSLAESYNTIKNAAPRPVRWFPKDDVVLVNAGDSKAKLSPAVRADLVVYLTQAIADQHFHIIDRREAAQTSEELDAIAAVHIGFALLIRDQYIDDLSERDHGLYDAESAAQGEEYTNAVDTVPVAYRAINIAFQVLGAVFVNSLAEDSEELLLQALSTHLPVALDQVSLPAAKYLRNDAVESIAPLPAPNDATKHYTEQLGAFRLFLMFSTGLPANEALTASDGWGNDRFTAYELDGRVCVDIHVVADSPNDADRLERALNGWAFARPSESNALTGREGVDLYVSVCDPGASVDQAVPGDDEINQYFGRAELMNYQATTSGKPDLAECIATDFYSQFTYRETAFATADSDIEAAYATIEEGCRNTL